ncbi:hypothetical protein DC31_02860 [Microbacterium sp. CH12i]|nr:hypothetical protein DC31_02860 [Microbacterium sp. CH12i]
MRLAYPATILGTIGALIGIAGSWIPSYWGDEAASVMSANRTWGSLATLLTNVDGVHGLYYAFLHLWVGVFGSSEFSTRLPSAIGAGFMIAGTVVLVRDVVGTKTAVVAGIISILLPRTMYMAVEARSYAIGAAAAVWVSVLVLRLLRNGGTRRGWIAYAIAAAASMYLFLYLGLLLIVHGVVAATLYRRELRRWGLSAVITVVLALPIIIVGFLQRSQISFLARRSYATASNVLIKQWFDAPLIAIISWVLIVAAIGWLIWRLTRRDAWAWRDRAHLTIAGVVWLALPTAILLIVNTTVSPVYNVRYLTFCTPAAAILISLGVVTLTERLTSKTQLTTTVLLLALLAAACAPAYVSQRGPFAKDGGSDWRAVATYVHDHAGAGQAIVFDQSTKPSRNPRLAMNLRPAEFAGLLDVALKTPYADRAWLWDSVIPNRDAVDLLFGVSDVWAVELTTNAAKADDVVLLEQHGYRIESTERVHRTTVYHLIKE